MVSFSIQSPTLTLPPPTWGTAQRSTKIYATKIYACKECGWHTGHSETCLALGDIMIVKGEADSFANMKLAAAAFGSFCTDLGVWFKTPKGIRQHNRSMIDHAVAHPPRSVLDGRGRKQGPAWDLFCQNLADYLEWANAATYVQWIGPKNIRAISTWTWRKVRD